MIYIFLNNKQYLVFTVYHNNYSKKHAQGMRRWGGSHGYAGAKIPVIYIFLNNKQYLVFTVYDNNYSYKPCSGYARDEEAAMVMLEHRYYGKSRPTQDLRFGFLLWLKGQCHEIFDFRSFSWISFPPALEYPFGTVSIFFENWRRYSQLKGAQVWDFRPILFYNNKSYMGRWLEDWRKFFFFRRLRQIFAI